jgi:hypothetical protein
MACARRQVSETLVKYTAVKDRAIDDRILGPYA